MNKEDILKRIEEIDSEISELKREADYYNSMQNALKIILNGSYGAFTTKYFVLYLIHVGASITAQGRDLIQTMSKFNEDYWYNIWHNDNELHSIMNIEDIRKINEKEDVSIYCDTDSVSSDTVIDTTNGKMTIEEFYNLNIENKCMDTIYGHESVTTDSKVLNYDDYFYYADVDRIIRHKVNKPKWELITETGKKINITDDHSMIVYRDGIKIEIKPSEILETDMILTKSEN